MSFNSNSSNQGRDQGRQEEYLDVGLWIFITNGQKIFNHGQEFWNNQCFIIEGRPINGEP